MDRQAVNILQLMIFPERFEDIVQECDRSITRPVAGDILKQLLHDELVAPFLEDPPGVFKRSLGYDSDHLEDYRYQITAKGIKLLESIVK